MPVKKIVASLVVIVVAVGGFIAGLILLQERQNINEKAAVPGGQATVTLSPASGSYKVGDTIKASIYFQTANIAISGVAVRLSYPYSGISPEVSVSAISVNSTFLSSGNWTCPTQNSSIQNGYIIIDVACGNMEALGFKTNTNTLLGTVDLLVNKAPVVSPLVVRFDPTLSIITRKTDNQDILLIPTSVGSYTITSTDVLTPTPTIVLTGSPTPTSRISVTPTKKVTVTLAPTEAAITDAGVSYPTLFSLFAGVLLIAGSLYLTIKDEQS
jgi:hypothetical protein